MSDDHPLGQSTDTEEPDQKVVRLPRTQHLPKIEQPEVQRGSKPGQRFMRLQRPAERRFLPGLGGGLRATQRAIEPRSPVEKALRSLRRVAVGTPISSEDVDDQRLSKTKALAVFSSDALSSSAYATDEILIVLVSAGVGSLTHSIKLALLIAGLLAVVAISYRQTIRAYPNGGGAYIVARENLGDGPGLVAAASLAVDYVLTVSVSIAAGVLAIVSAFPALLDYRVEISVVAIGLITLANLRGIKESGTLFALPTYGFIISFLVLLIGGYLKFIGNPDLRAPIPEDAYAPGTAAVGAFLLLRAFASGCTALTGIEAISNGIPAFKKPESHNASITLAWMAAILTTFFVGLTVLGHLLDVQPSENVSVAAQIGRTIYGDGVLFIAIQAFTALILILAANTSYADFPRLASILARDRFLPHQFTFRGDRLAFSNGIIVLGVCASVLVIVFSANVTRLIPLYAFGVFVSFTLSQTGMIKHWLRTREPHWKRSAIVNSVGGVTTAVVAVIVGVTKFEHGAWISMLAMALLTLLFWTIHRHFRLTEQRLTPEPYAQHSVQASQQVLVPVEELNRAVLLSLDYARLLSDNVVALHVTDDAERGRRLAEEWEALVPDVPLVLIDSPYRSLVAPVLSYIDALQLGPADMVTVVVPAFHTTYPWGEWLHNQSASRLRKALRQRPNTVIAELPYDLGHAPVAGRA